MQNKSRLRLLSIIFLSIIFFFHFFNCVSHYNKSLNGSTYYPTSKPFTRWWWFAGPVDTADIMDQLDWLKQNGFGGVEIAWIYPIDGEPVPGTPEWLSPQWSDLVVFTRKYAVSIGLGCDFTFGTLWPFGDSRVPPEDGSITYGETESQAEMRLTWEHPVRGRVLNHLDSSAFNRYADRVGSALSEAMQVEPSGIFCDSWEVETRRIWTEGFGEIFKDTFGYQLEPYMDNIYEPGYEDIFYDYMKVVSDYVLYQFYKPFTETAHRLGGFSRAQCGGAPADLLTAFSLVDVPETEAILYEPNFARIPVSAAVLSEKPIVSSETFTCLYGWKGWPGPGPRQFREKTTDMKLLADALFVQGVNHIIWHGMPFNGKDDNNHFYASVHVGPDSYFTEDIPGFNRYMENICDIMRRGKPYTDVAVYLPLEDSWMGVEYPDSLKFPWVWGEYELRYVHPPEKLKGYQPLWINQYFLERAEIKDNRLICGQGSFSSLYVDVSYLDMEALQTILAIAKQGFPICFPNKPAEPGRKKSENYESLVEELLSLPNVSDDFYDIAENLPLVQGTENVDFWCRSVESTAYIFFAHPQTRNISYPLKYGQALETERIKRKISINWQGDRFSEVLEFKPGQSLLTKVDKAGVEFIDIEFMHQK